MSEFHIQVTKLGKIADHPNADTLSITSIMGYPVIFKKGLHKENDLIVYIPIDSVVPLTDTRFSWLEKPRIRAVRLRGIFSMGIIVNADPSWTVGQNVQNELGITKYDPPEPIDLSGDNERDLSGMPKYTDIEGFRKFSNIIKEGEEVVLTEKIHGTNFRTTYNDGRLWVGSHNCIKKLDGNTAYAKIITPYKLDEVLKENPKYTLFGEIYGWIQNLRYNMKQGEYKLALFDVFDKSTMKYLDYENFTQFVDKYALPRVPVLYKGPWKDELKELSNGKSTIADHIKEGFVVKPVVERFDMEIGRVILKFIGEEYMLKNDH